MKKLVCLILALIMLAALAACGPKPGPVEPTAAPNEGDREESLDNLTEGKPGNLLYSAFAGRYPGLKALALSGNVAGSAEFNSREPAQEGIRYIFELNEWVEFSLVCEETQGDLAACVFAHRALSKYKEFNAGEALWSEEFELAPVIEGSFYLDPEETRPGWYDLIFTVDGKIVSLTYLKMYAPGELSGLNDKQLYDLMK